MNRGSRRGVLFDTPLDYAAFVAVLREAHERVQMRLLAIALMRNHFHLVLWPFEDGDLQEYMRWLLTTHACRWHTAHGTRGTGALYQGRYLAIPVQNERHLLTVCRYVEQNPVRAGLVGRASEWRWSSASARPGASLPPLAECPVRRPFDWHTIVDAPAPVSETAIVRDCLSRNAPLGDAEWSQNLASRIGWRTGLRPPGRPRTRKLE
jgi:putative transposase